MPLDGSLVLPPPNEEARTIKEAHEAEEKPWLAAVAAMEAAFTRQQQLAACLAEASETYSYLYGTTISSNSTLLIVEGMVRDAAAAAAGSGRPPAVSQLSGP